MFTCKTGHHVGPAFILAVFCLGATSKVFALDVLAPKSNADYGSGSSAANLYYPGGIPGIGLFVGQPNTLPRNDRAVVRFNISRYLLSARPVDSATFCFRVSSFYASEDGFHEIEIMHLSYDADSLSANDLLNAHVEIVESVSVPVKKATNNPADPNKEYTLDVTKYINADIGKGNLYSAFRFRDVTAETKDRGDATQAYGICLKNLLQLKLR